jgi:hypothetical protein
MKHTRVTPLLRTISATVVVVFFLTSIPCHANQLAARPSSYAQVKMQEAQEMLTELELDEDIQNFDKASPEEKTKGTWKSERLRHREEVLSEAGFDDVKQQLASLPFESVTADMAQEMIDEATAEEASGEMSAQGATTGKVTDGFTDKHKHKVKKWIKEGIQRSFQMTLEKVKDENDARQLQEELGIKEKALERMAKLFGIDKKLKGKCCEECVKKIRNKLLITMAVVMSVMFITILLLGMLIIPGLVVFAVFFAGIAAFNLYIPIMITYMVYSLKNTCPPDPILSPAYENMY